MGRPKKAKPTAEEIAQAEIASQQWSHYQEYGIPLENEWIRRTTGYAMNPETGEYEVDTSAGVRNEDGTVVTDTSSAATSNSEAFGRAMSSVNPNRLEQAEQIERDSAAQGAASEAGMKLNQQRNANIGMMNVVAHGKGLETESVARQSQLAQLSQQDAFTQADKSRSNSATNAYLLGTAGGLAGATLAQKGRLDSFDPTVTPRPGDHHQGT